MLIVIEPNCNLHCSPEENKGETNEAIALHILNGEKDIEETSGDRIEPDALVARIFSDKSHLDFFLSCHNNDSLRQDYGSVPQHSTSSSLSSSPAETQPLVVNTG